MALSIFSREGKTRQLCVAGEPRQRRLGRGARGAPPVRPGPPNRRLLAGGISQGERKLLDVAVAYALRPKLLFLDEPTSGVSHAREGADHGHRQLDRALAEITAVIIEHDMDIVFRYSERIVVMHQGTILADGTPDEIRATTRSRRR